MKIVVCVKQAVDTEAVLALDEQGGVSKEGQTLVIDPYSEFAVEKAVQIKEAQSAEVVAVCLGDAGSMPVLRHALAMGADSAVLIDDAEAAAADPARKASVLAAAIKDMGADLVMGGCKSSDTGRAQVMVRVAALLGIGCVNTVVGLEVEGGVLHAVREIDDGVVRIDAALPAAVCAQQGLAEPRYPTVRDIMQSKRKPVATVAASAAEDAAAAEVVSVREKPKRAGGLIVEGETVADAVHRAVDLVRTEAKVL